MVNILVIGASGYVGEATALELRRRGNNVVGLVRDAAKATELVKGEVHVVVGDIDKAETIQEAVKNADVIINTAMDFTNPELDLRAYQIISSIIEKAGGNKKKVIFLSGFLANNPGDAKLTEESPIVSDAIIQKIAAIVPFFGPMLTKRIEAEKLVINSKLFDGYIARAPMIYGGKKGHWTIHFSKAEEGKVGIYGGGGAIISSVHVHDFVEGLARLVEIDSTKVSPQIFYFAEFEGPTQREIAYALAKGAGKDKGQLQEEDLPFPFPAWAQGNLWVDSTKAKKLLGWNPGHNLIRDAKVLYDSWKAYGLPGQF